MCDCLTENICVVAEITKSFTKLLKYLFTKEAVAKNKYKNPWIILLSLKMLNNLKNGVILGY